MDTLRIAFSGAGYIARVHAQAVWAAPGATPVALVDHQPDTKQSFTEQFGITRVYTRVEDLLADGEVDALVVCTPNYLHAHESLAALKAGVHVLVEKPMAMNAREAQEMVAAARDNHVVLMVAHNWRFDEEVMWLRRQVLDGRIGRVIRTKGYAVHVNWGPRGWFTQRDLAGGGAAADMGVHALDTARFIMGDPQPVSVYARLGSFYQNFDVEDTALMMINWDNGAVSYIESGWWQPHADMEAAATQVYGVHGMAQVFPTRLVRFTEPGAPPEEIDGGFRPRVNHYSPEMYQRQMAAFINCIQGGKPSLQCARQGMINMQILDAAYESARTDQLVHIQEIEV
ncbi:MAG TPA: Gfo/Idh/MocA family oxidoreductase [Anaerolineaceae bacterium]|nr:Gfo/Idh/MocA family oxidoreductase [Anaerolineaceae bacterium]HPN50726.1 Gfo/Idh/MocA family oxidoreductase [Anaerolineaceae bacterium]